MARAAVSAQQARRRSVNKTHHGQAEEVCQRHEAEQVLHAEGEVQRVGHVHAVQLALMQVRQRHVHHRQLAAHACVTAPGQRGAAGARSGAAHPRGTRSGSRCSAARARGPGRSRTPARRVSVSTPARSAVGAGFAERTCLAEVEGVANELAEGPGDDEDGDVQRGLEAAAPRQRDAGAQTQLLRAHLRHNPEHAPQHPHARANLRRRAAHSQRSVCGPNLRAGAARRALARR